MKNIITQLFLAITLTTCITMHAAESNDTSSQSSILDYSAHVATGSLVKLLPWLTQEAISHIKQEFLGDVPSYISLPLGIAYLYIRYKTPQWTDTYLLKKKELRTTKQNIINFIIRSISFGSSSTQSYIKSIGNETITVTHTVDITPLVVSIISAISTIILGESVNDWLKNAEPEPITA